MNKSILLILKLIQVMYIESIYESLSKLNITKEKIYSCTQIHMN